MVDLVEKVARAIDPYAFEDWQRSFDYEVKQSGDRDEAQRFAEWSSGKKIERAKEQARAALAAMSEAGGEGWQTPEGWRLVPVEPTPEMMKAAGRYDDHCAVHNYGGSADAEGLWDAMLEAAPAPPAKERG